MGEAVVHRIDLQQNEITWDEIRFDPSGLIRLQGWSFLNSEAITTPELIFDDHVLQLLNRWRYWRPDLNKHLKSAAHPLAGFGFEWLAPNGRAGGVTLNIKGAPPLAIRAEIEISRPDYAFLFDSSDVVGREQIYGSGLPCLTVDQQIRALTLLMSGRILDFGCGAGALVSELRQHGKEAFGIEINRPTITENLIGGAVPYIKLYEGGALPFENNSFDCVTAFEVLEHVPDYKFALSEICRVSPRLMMSVPDIAAVPMLHRHNVVPWHLLESTHLNFFTETSLRQALKPHFAKIEIGRLGEIETNGTRYFISLLAVCER